MEGLTERDESEGEKSGCRCLDTVRYVVSAVVVVLIVAITAKAIKVVLRPDKLSLSVAGGSVYTRRFPSSRVEGNKLMFVFKLRGENPSSRAGMYYLNITTYLFDNTTKPAAESSSPGNDSLIFFKMGDMAVLQMEYEDRIMQSDYIIRNSEVIVISFFDKLNRQGGIIQDATMRVDGILVTETSSLHNTTPQPTTYYCRQLVVGLNPDDQASMSSQATSCTTSP